MDLVVIGLGYVGLPLVREVCRAGLEVGGLDRDARVVAGLKAGLSHIDDVSTAEVEQMNEAGFTPSLHEDILDGARTVVICVPTPLSEEGGPDLTAVRGAAETVARHLEPGMLVVLESTTYPGTTDEVVRPILEKSGLVAGEEFHLAFSPERIDPGNPVYGVRNTPKIVGGLTPACASAAAAFYGKFVEQVVEAKGTREAEMAKLLENTYRHVNIALVNEMAVFCNELGIDLWDAIDCAATKPFGFQAFRPGPGVGGHCIPIDPNYLSYKVRSLGYPFRFVELAQEINDRMPRYIVERAQQLLNREGRALKDARVLLLGVTYKADIADQRESPARPVARRLARLGADLSFHDPFVSEWLVEGTEVRNAGDDLPAALAAADLVVVLADHAAYDAATLARHSRLLFDTRGRTRDLRSETVELL
ncbi:MULTISPECIES: nucleotide sugar dehydrogenase [Actinomadura]|uniref:Nucleotide sugar dehydrogenase n=1 Tax=Actinomadura litoris TaxID=2678616 RepID=A0A7K1L7D5_9ACTN|nr:MULTISPECIES: nucleotide sugar dehydrogenase [Actinomadura]MBT2210660.1 nucleotide sugar dehydrogenase [Actinomadura sp. NEAU-AAG7]MUN40347.1 nucleotide sugar dehydrogenase [Actinomadura litoris]